VKHLKFFCHMRFAADYSETMEVFFATCGLRQITVKLWEDPYQECDLGYSSRHAPQNMARARISSGRSPCYQGSPHRGLLRSVKTFQSFTVFCRKPHVASSICLRATIFQNPEGTHCAIIYIKITNCNMFQSLQDHHQGVHTSSICV
jgi:hypothetical protein